MRLSIITINYNNAAGLRKTLESVKVQTSSDWEHIIVDGGSTDGSVDVIIEYLSCASYASHVTWWCSEKDKGIYDAMNKGIPHATGEYILMLNSGDYFTDSGAVGRVCGASFTEDLVYYDATFVGSYGKTVFTYPDAISPVYFTRHFLLNQQNLLVRTDFQKAHLFSTEYKIAGDYDFELNAIVNLDCSLRHVKDSIACFENESGMGSSPEWEEIQDREGRAIRSKYFTKSIWRDLCDYEDYVYGYRGILPKMRKILNKIARVTTRRKVSKEDG